MAVAAALITQFAESFTQQVCYQWSRGGIDPSDLGHTKHFVIFKGAVTYSTHEPGTIEIRTCFWYDLAEASYVFTVFIIG